MKCYIGDAEATDATIDSQGWLHTGDIGYYDEDGYFFVTDRMKELIKYKGLQVSPTELEKVLLTHPDVLDVAVAPVTDPAAGEIPRAYIVKRLGSTVTDDELAIFLSGNQVVLIEVLIYRCIGYCRRSIICHIGKVSPYKQLRGGVIFVDVIPKTSTGKIIRRALKENLPSKL